MKRLTDTQKTAIQDLRMSGLGYKSIAERLSLSRETVRSFCVRNNISAVPAVNTDMAAREAVGTTEIKVGGTVFVITTGYSKKAMETLEKKLEKLILDAVPKQSKSYHFVQQSA